MSPAFWAARLALPGWLVLAPDSPEGSALSSAVSPSGSARASEPAQVTVSTRQPLGVQTSPLWGSAAPSLGEMSRWEWLGRLLCLPVLVACLADQALRQCSCCRRAPQCGAPTQTFCPSWLVLWSSQLWPGVEQPCSSRPRAGSQRRFLRCSRCVPVFYTPGTGRIAPAMLLRFL